MLRGLLRYMLRVRRLAGVLPDSKKQFFALLCLVLAVMELPVIQIIMRDDKVHMGPNPTF